MATKTLRVVRVMRDGNSLKSFFLVQETGGSD